MKMIRNWIILIIGMIALSVMLFVTGRQHTVYIENGNKKDRIKIAAASYSVDGNENVKIKPKKKKVELVKGVKHKIVVEVKGEDGKVQKIEKTFSLKITGNASISIPLLLQDDPGWIKEIE